MTDDPAKQDPLRVPLPVEETPIIDPVSDDITSEREEANTEQNVDERVDVIPEASRVFDPDPVTMTEITPQTPVNLPPARTKGGNHFGTALFIILLFGLGVWLSSQFRSFFAPIYPNEAVVPTRPVVENSPISLPESSSSAVAPISAWLTYDVINGSTKKPITGVTYKLPSSVKAPVCDSQSCVSQGTNLPGGTRFTVAPRGKGQSLPDFRGAILTDAAGREFSMKQGVFGGAYAYEYTGNFTGRTGGGYTFTAIRGVLMPVSEALAIEFNHFAPAGVTSDFEKDDVLFNEIIASLSIAGGPVASPTARPTVSTPLSTPVATPSGN